jgi:hypothetical protein
MAAEVLHFYGWHRSGIFAFAEDGPLDDGRLTARLSLTVEDRDTGEQDSGDIDFRIAGPPDVRGLLPAAITGMMPPPGTTNAEATKYVFVELASPDLPWRYTPDKQPDSLALRPWIVLVVGTPDEIILQQPSSGENGTDLLQTITLSADVTNDHPLVDEDGNRLSARWAHVQQKKNRTGRLVTRLLSPRKLEPEQEYIAAIVPAFKEDGSPSWKQGDTPTLRCFHSWRFRTGEAGDFTTLARALRPGEDDPILGQAPLFYPRVDPADPLWVRGPLAPIGSIDASLPPPVGHDVEGLLATRDAEPLPDEPNFWWPIVSMPRYGSPWVADPTLPAWFSEINHDPRHRGVAGLGAWAGVELQEQILDAAVTQAGALGNAEQRIRHLVLGLSAARSLWHQRLPTDSYQRLLLYGPSLRRIITTSGPALHAIAGAEQPLPARLFSSAARRLLRPGPARTALAAPGAVAPWNILPCANKCPPPPKKNYAGLPHVDAVAESLGLGSIDCDKQIEAALEALYALLERIGFEGELDYDDAMAALDELCGVGIPGKPNRPCQPVTLEAVEPSLTDAIDPTGDAPLVQRRVLAGITGLDDPPTAPTEVCVGLDLPVWTFLRDRAPNWLLPGVNTLADNTVVALQSNQTFVDAFLVGLSGQTVNEMRFRNLPIATGCTPMRMFWGQVNTNVEPAIRRPDIRGMELWNLTCAGDPNDVPLGDPQHQPCAEEGGEASSGDSDLVVVFRSDLFRRYPRTIVYAAPAPLGNGTPNWEATEPFSPGTEILPTFQGSIGEDITFFRFDLDPAEAQRWWIVLEEPPPGYSFDYMDPASISASDGAWFAHDTFHDPVRVLIRGDSIIPGS